MLQRCLDALGDCSRDRDVIIRIEGDQIVEARSDQLRRVSRFFRQALTDDARVDGKFMIAISGISKDVLDTLLTYAETGTLNLYEHEVADVYFAAHKLQMPFVVHKCLQVRPQAKLEALAVGPSKAVPKSPQADGASASTRIGPAAAEVKDGAPVEAKADQEQPQIKLEALAISPSKAVPKSPQGDGASASTQTGAAAAEVKDGSPVKAKVDQPHAGNEAGAAATAEGQLKSEPKSPLSAPPAAQEAQPTGKPAAEAEAKSEQVQPTPGVEAAQVDAQQKPEIKSPLFQQPTQEPGTTGIDELKPAAKDTARVEVKPDKVEASATKSETEIPRILRIAPKPSRPQDDGGVADEISADARDDTYRAPSKKDKPGTSKDDQRVNAAPHDTAKASAVGQKPSEAAAGGQSKPGTPKDIEQKPGPITSVQTAVAGGGPQVTSGPSKVVSGSKATTPKSATGPKGTPVQGARTPVQKPEVQEVIVSATSQAQVLSAAPPMGARPKERTPVEQQPRPVTPPSAAARTFLDVVLEHFKQLSPNMIRSLEPARVIELLKKDDLEICCEIPVFVASLVWLHEDYPNRSAYARELMGCVRFSRMTADQLIHCFFPPLRPEVVDIPEVKELLLGGCCYLCASLQQWRHLFPQYAVQPRKYSGRHMCHLWQLPYPRDTEDEVRVQLDITRETYLQQRHCHCSADTHDGLSLEGRLYGIARTLLLRRRYIDLHCYQPDPEEASRGPLAVVQRSFGKRRYSVQKRLEWTEGVWRQVGFSARLGAPRGEPVVAILGGCEPDKPDRVSAGLCMARLYPRKSPFFKRFGILPRPLYHVKAVCFNRTVYVVGGLDLRQAALRVKRPSRCCFALDLPNMQWRRLADMSQGRLFHVLAEHQGRLYAIGGLGDHNRVLSSAECYDPSADRWTTQSGRLCCPRMASASVILGRGRLVLGGGAMRPVGGSGNAYLVDDVVVLKLPQLTPEHLAGGQRLPRLPSARLSSSMAVLANGGLLVVGGATYGPSGFRSLDDVLLLKRPGTDTTWTKLRPTPFRIHSALVVAIGQDAYAIGGCTDRQEGDGVRTNMMVMRGGCRDHHHDDADLCWEPWGALPGRLVGMEAVVFRAEDARPSDPSAL